MKKLDMKSMDITGDNIAKIRALFPSAVTEVMGDDGKVKLAIDFDCLKQELSEDLVSERAERYQMTWPDKSKAKVLANSRITATLRPDKEKSVDFNTTENLYIEGDNLDVLKLLRETYLGKVKMIYIDPPYNTGNDFVYEDDFAMSTEDYAEVSGQYDEQGNRLVKNLDSNGRFHTDWLNMIYPRLKVARDLLADDGAIFISIDDNEINNLRKMCDEVFGEGNFVAQLSVIVKTEGRQYGHFAKTHEYLLVYAKSNDSVTMNEIRVTDGEFKYYDEKGGFNTIGLRNRAVRIFNSTNRPNLRYPFYVDVNNKDNYGFSKVSTLPLDGWQEVWASVVDGLESVWRWGKETAEKNKDELVALQGNDGEIRIFKKDRDLTTLPKTVWFEKELNSIVGTREVANIVGKGMFDFPKPLYLLKRIVEIATDENSLVLDFFSGSATTAHAVIQLNAEDDGNRKFIMVQLPEKCDEKSEAYKAGYKTICDIGEERIRRAGERILAEWKTQRLLDNITVVDEKHYTKKQDTWDIINDNSLLTRLDIGFRVLKLDSSNMKEVYYNPSAMTQDILAMTVDNVKADRTPLDLLFQVMLDLGIELSAKIEENSVNGKTYYAVNGNDIIACFDDDIDNDVITAIAKQNPLYVVFKDKSFATDSVGINNEQLFKTYSPSTVVKVI